MHKKDICTDRAVRTNDRFAADDGCARVDGDVVLDGWVAFLPLERLSTGQRTRDEADALIHLHMMADGAGLPDDRAGAVVHEEMRADLCARVQVHPAAAVRPLGHDARNEHDALPIQLMRHPLHGDGLDEGISDDDLLLAQGRRVTIVGGLGIGLEDVAQPREAAEKL